MLKALWKRATSEARTRDLRVTNALLYQLSYCGGVSGGKIIKNNRNRNDKPTLFVVKSE